MSVLTLRVPSDPSTVIRVGSEGAVHICDGDERVIRIIDAKQARDIAHALDRAADHAEGKLIGGGV